MKADEWNRSGQTSREQDFGLDSEEEGKWRGSGGEVEGKVLVRSGG